VDCNIEREYVLDLENNFLLKSIDLFHLIMNLDSFKQNKKIENNHNSPLQKNEYSPRKKNVTRSLFSENSPQGKNVTRSLFSENSPQGKNVTRSLFSENSPFFSNRGRILFQNTPRYKQSASTRENNESPPPTKSKPTESSADSPLSSIGSIFSGITQLFPSSPVKKNSNSPQNQTKMMSTSLSPEKEKIIELDKSFFTFVSKIKKDCILISPNISNRMIYTYGSVHDYTRSPDFAYFPQLEPSAFIDYLNGLLGTNVSSKNIASP
jgi:hypothetical protein